MTENKRFVQNTNLVMQNNEVYVVCGDEHSADVVTTALNELINKNEQLKSENNLFFGKVFDILLKYQDLFNREMADEVLEELGIELTRWFE